MREPETAPREFAFAPGRFPLAAAGVLVLLAVLQGAGGPALLLPATVVALAAAGIDCVRGWRLPGAVSCEAPDLVRWHLDREETFSVALTASRKSVGAIRVGLTLPEGFAVKREIVNARLDGAEEVVRVGWSCVPRRRGVSRVASVYVETGSPWRCWRLRRAVPVESEIRVYPNLDTERTALSAIFLRRTLTGSAPWRQVGRGREFEQLRDYQPGDAFDEIHWKATAKRREPVTKVFRVEQTQEVYAVIDASRLSGRRPEGESEEGFAAGLLERQITAALALGAAAESQGDHFGLIAFSDRVHRFVRARGGRAAYQGCREALLELQPREVSPDFGELSAFILSRLTRRALLVYLTFLDDPAAAETFVRAIPRVTRRHLARVVMVRSPGVRPLLSDGGPGGDDDVHGRIAGHLHWRQLDETGGLLRARGAPFSLIDREKTAAHLISQYMRIKQRQIL